MNNPCVTEYTLCIKYKFIYVLHFLYLKIYILYFCNCNPDENYTLCIFSSRTLSIHIYEIKLILLSRNLELIELRI